MTESTTVENRSKVVAALAEYATLIEKPGWGLL
jgi:hypothetical protein